MATSASVTASGTAPSQDVSPLTATSPSIGSKATSQTTAFLQLPVPTTTVTPPQQNVINLTLQPESSQLPTLATKSLFPSSPFPFPHMGRKRSPSPNFLANLQPSKGRSPSPALMSKSSSSQAHYSRSHSPISMIQHSQSDSSVLSLTHEAAPPPTKKKRLFHRELMSMMRGFGDDSNPYSETVDLIEELVVRFITEMTQKAMEVGKSGRVQVNDIIFIIRKDPKKYARVKDLLTMKEQIDKAKKAFTEDAETSDE